MRLEQTTRQLLILCLLGFGISVFAFFLSRYVGFLSSTNDLLLDKFMLHSANRQPDNRLLVIEIDDESINKLGNPIPRNNYVKLIRKLSSFGCKTIVFDILFIDEEDSTVDSQLASVTDSAGHIIHSFFLTDEEPDSTLFQDKSYEKYAIKVKDETDLNVIPLWDAFFPAKRFINDFNQAGCITAVWDYDGRSRRLPLFMEFDNLVYPTLGITALLDYFGVTEKAVKIEKSFWGRNVIIETPHEILKIPINSEGQALLNFYGIFDKFDPIPLHKIIDLVDAFQPKNPTNVSLSLFERKIVLIGDNEIAVDKHPTPFSANFPGLGFHATFISNILKGDLITEVSWYINAIISAILSLLILGVFIYYQHFSKPMRYFSIIAITMLIIFNLTAYFLVFDYFRIWFKLVQIDCVFMFLFIFLLFYEKVIRLKKLNSKISQIENNIFIKKTDLDKLDQEIDSQTEQYKTLKYLAAQLQTALKDPHVNQQGDMKNFFPEFYERQEIIKSKLEEQIRQLEKEKEKIHKEKAVLEQEKDIIENLVKRNIPKEEKVISEKVKIDKVQLFQEVMEAWQYFQSYQKRKNSQPNATFGITAVPETLNEKGETVNTTMGEIFEKVKKVASYNSSVLITGEIGTGKGVIAKAIHEQSTRADKEFVAINCAAIPETLLESILFGHEKGIFTGAVTERKGKFEYANGGTIFLDEIGDMKLDLQAKLLRVLEEREIQKVGSNRTIKVDVRVITATNKNLDECIKNNKFREDLFSRLNVVNFHIPPLQERKGDIPFLIKDFLAELNKQYSIKKSFSDEATIAAMCYDYRRGNVRDLQHLVENAYVLTTENTIDFLALPDDIQAAYRNIFESEEVPLWSQIEENVHYEKERLLSACKIAIKENNVDEFLQSNNLQANNEIQPNCYKDLLVLVNGMASIFPQDKRETLVRKTIVQMQKQLFQWCREEKIAKLSELYDTIEKILGRSRRQIDNWREV